MLSCNYTRGPPLNTDISGIGVRISFYLQTLFLGFLSARSGSIHEIAGALYTLMSTNAAMGITGLILGLKPVPEISLQDALVILYLLSMSWIVVIASLASCNRLSDDTQTLQLVLVLQSCIILAFAFAVLATAPYFGTTPECNQNTRVVIFRPFPALKAGRIFGGILFGLAFLAYTAMTARDCWTRSQDKRKREEPAKEDEVKLSRPQQQPPDITTFIPSRREPKARNQTPRKQSTLEYLGQAHRNIDGALLFMLFFILIAWAAFVLNTELLIRWNGSAAQNGGSSWQFGQILPMFLTLLPLVNMISAFRQFHLRPTKQVERQELVKVTVDI